MKVYRGGLSVKATRTIGWPEAGPGGVGRGSLSNGELFTK
jgi:hypothetical protein